MQPKFTLSNLWPFCMKVFVIASIFISMAGSSYSQLNLFSEGFATVSPLPAGWSQQNLSTPVGTNPNWIQGDGTNYWPSHSGGPNDWILCTFNSVGGATGNTISNWLFTPNVTLTNGDVFSFWTRTVPGPQFPDRLQVRMSTNGTSTDVGATNTSVGDFTTLLLDINPTYIAANYPENWTLESITISGLAAPISGRIAFRYFVEDGGPNGTNSDNIGIDDVTYFQAVTPACTTPTPGNTLSTSASACPGSPFTLSVQNNTAGTGVTYQWQSSPDGTTYTDIPGATASTYTTSITGATYYQLVVSCSGTPGTSTPIQILLTPASGCYCAAASTDMDPTFEKIAEVQFGSLDNTSTSLAGYENFLAVPAPTIEAGASTPITITGNGNTYAGDVVKVWIDYNHNGSFGDAGENVFTSPQSAGPYMGNIVVPASALTGNTVMRIRLYDDVFGNGNNTPCGDNVYGEVEDYTINIIPCTQASITAQPVDATTSCPGSATFTVGASAGTQITYQWEQRINATASWTNVVDGPGYSGAMTNTLTVSNATVSMDGYQYRALISGACTATDFSDPATLTVNPLVINVNPASVTSCSSSTSPVGLAITTINPSGSSVTATTGFPSGTLNTIIPDGSNAGITNAIPVSLPPGAVITAASVTLNIDHTFIGDLVVALKAPNGNVLNLDYGLTQTGGVGPTTGFVNTVISSAGTNTLVSGSDPWTGIFAPDAPAAPGTVPTAPTSLSNANANVFTFSDLYSTPSGNWTLGILDFAPPDEGSLVNWTLTLTYTYPVGQPYTGVWSPATGLFTNAAATVPYVAGTEEDSVWVVPSTTMDYTVTVTNAACTPAPATIPVTVNDPISNIISPTNAASGCDGGNATFTVSASGNPINYQWQVSTDGGATFTDISDGGIYSGATTATLTLTNIPGAANQNQYWAILSSPSCNTDTSAAATLTVNPNPVVTVTASPYTSIFPGLQTTLTAVTTPPASGATYQWFLNGEAIPGATNSTYVVTTDGFGDYTVQVIDANSCRGISAAALTVRDSLNTNLFIYPNPNTGTFNVSFNDRARGLITPRTLSVYDSKGARVYSKQFPVTAPFERMTVDLRKCAKGVYMIDLTDPAGNRLGAERVIVY